jgi:hypothetical protein
VVAEDQIAAARPRPDALRLLGVPKSYAVVVRLRRHGQGHPISKHEGRRAGPDARRSKQLGLPSPTVMKAASCWLTLLAACSMAAARVASLREAHNVLWLVAHREARLCRSRLIGLTVGSADDEALFFAPSIIRLLQEGKTCHILSLSNGLSRERLPVSLSRPTGNAEGQGSVRGGEMLASCAQLGIPSKQCRVMNLECVCEASANP